MTKVAHLNGQMKVDHMNKNTIRLGLAAVAAFYVVTGGLWAADFFPLQKFYAAIERQGDLVEKLGFERAWESPQYKAANDYQQAYALTHGDILETEGRLALYRALLLWGTVGLGAAGGVLFVTRGRGGADKGAAQ